MATRSFVDLTENERIKLIERVISACSWLRIMGDSDVVTTNEGQKTCPLWNIPHSKYMIMLYGDWMVGGLCRLVVLNNETNIARAIAWIFEDEEHAGMVNVPDDISEIISALDCYDVMKERRYQELEGFL